MPQLEGEEAEGTGGALGAGFTMWCMHFCSGCNVESAAVQCVEGSPMEDAGEQAWAWATGP